MSNEDEIVRKREMQTKEQYEALGRFIQSFELMVFHVRHSILSLLGARGENQITMNIILNKTALTAKPLWDIMCGIIGQLLNEGMRQDLNRNDIQGIVFAIGGEYQKLLQIRNKMVHGTFLIGFGSTDQEEYSEFKVLKGKSSIRYGFAFEDDMPKTSKQINTLSDRCNKQRKNIVHLSAIFIFPEIGIEECFQRDGKRWKVTE